MILRNPNLILHVDLIKIDSICQCVFEQRYNLYNVINIIFIATVFRYFFKYI